MSARGQTAPGASLGGQVVRIVGLLTALTTAGPLQAQFGPSPVAVTKVIEQEVSAGQSFVGSVMPVRQSVVGSAVAGRVLEFYVNEGDRVKKDQPLAQLRTEALEIQLAAAQADWELRKQELAEMENGSRPEEIAQCEARMAGAKAMMDFRRSRYSRVKELVEKRASSTDELQDASSAAEAAFQAFQEAKSNWEMTSTGPRKEQILQSKARVASALEECNRIEDQLRKHTIVSPFDGYVTAEHTEIGQWISQAAPVAEVVELHEVDVQAHVLESYVPHLEVGMTARVELGALPGEALVGHVALIVPKADLKSRSFPVKIRLTNREVGGSPLIKAGMLARVMLPVGRPEKALLVPKDAVVLGGPAPLVYVVDPDPKASGMGTARAVPVELGVVHEDLIQVKGPLKIGESVVTRGNERIRPGQSVTIVSQAATAQK